MELPKPGASLTLSLHSLWPLEGAEELRDELIAAHRAPERRFHDAGYLLAVLTRLDELALSGTPYDRLPVSLAAWFRHSLNDGERDAEERAAQWARIALAGVADEATAVEVERLVLLTATHLPEADDHNGAVLSDADLAVLGEGPELYARYREQLRAEFAHLSDADFADGRTRVIEGLLDRTAIFHTQIGARSWESSARANLAAELHALRALV